LHAAQGGFLKLAIEEESDRGSDRDFSIDTSSMRADFDFDASKLMRDAWVGLTLGDNLQDLTGPIDIR
jgi:hypothetical protein